MQTGSMDETVIRAADRRGGGGGAITEGLVRQQVDRSCRMAPRRHARRSSNAREGTEGMYMLEGR